MSATQTSPETTRTEEPTVFALLRATSGLQQTELADRLGVSYSTARRLEAKGGLPKNPAARQRTLAFCSELGVAVPDDEGGNVASDERELNVAPAFTRRRAARIRPETREAVSRLNPSKSRSSKESGGDSGRFDTLLAQIGIPEGSVVSMTALLELLKSAEPVRESVIRALTQRVVGHYGEISQK